MASGVLLASWVFSSTIKNVGQVHLNTFFAPFQFIFRMKTNAFYQSFCESAKKQCFQNSIRISLCKLPFVKLNITHVKHVFSELFFCNLASIFAVDKMIQILKETFEKGLFLEMFYIPILYSIWLQAPSLSERTNLKRY